MKKNKNILQSDWVDSLSSLAPEALVREVRHQSQPRRWPWQPKTLRDMVNERQSHLSDLVAERSAEMAGLLADRRDHVKKTVRHQSHPRRFPWQQKTARDYLDARIEKMTELAAERSAELAALAATRRDNILGRIEAESHPRRFPWQQKTTRDRLDERVGSLASQAANRRDHLVEEAAARRDELLSQFEHEARGRRFPWQQKTARDRLDEHLGDVSSQVAGRRDELAAQVEAARADLLGQLEAESSHRRFPWQKKTVRDKAEERLSDLETAFTENRGSVQEALKSAPAALGVAALGAIEAVKGSAGNTSSNLRDSADELSKRVSETRDHAAANVRSVAKAPVKAINRKVESGKRTVRWSARVVKVAFWALLIGAAIGVLYSPRSGRELRAEIRTVVMDILNKILPA